MVHAIIGLLQLCCLGCFGVGVYMLNQYAPKRMAARVFKLKYLLATIGIGLVVFFLAAKLINIPARLQTTPVALVKAHDQIRATCKMHYEAQRYDDAYDTINQRTKTAELVGEHAQKLKDARTHKTTIAKLLSPILNSVLFHTGVAVAFLPALLRLLLLLFQKKRRLESGTYDEKFIEKERREFGVFLPIMNAVTLLSLCTSPTFYFFIEPGRAHRCIYSSGHWYTFTCTCLTFAIVLTHLYRNRNYCKSSMKLLTWYFVWCVIYLAMALMVLKTTQTFYHDDAEAVDGIMQALPAFCVFTFVLIAYQFLTASKRDIDIDSEVEVRETPADLHAPPTLKSSKAKRTLGMNPPGENIVKSDQAKTQSEKAKKLLGVEGGEQAPPRVTRASSRKSAGEAAASSSSSSSSEKVVTPPSLEDEPVIVNRSEGEDEPGANDEVPNAPPAPPAAPDAPPAPTISSSRAPIKITKRTKESAPSKPNQADATSAMLEDIKKPHALRKTVTNANRPAASDSVGNAGGLMGQLSLRLAKVRAAVDGEKEEENDGDNEWKY